MSAHYPHETAGTLLHFAALVLGVIGAGLTTAPFWWNAISHSGNGVPACIWMFFTVASTGLGLSLALIGNRLLAGTTRAGRIALWLNAAVLVLLAVVVSWRG